MDKGVNLKKLVLRFIFKFYLDITTHGKGDGGHTVVLDDLLLIRCGADNACRGDAAECGGMRNVERRVW